METASKAIRDASEVTAGNIVAITSYARVVGGMYDRIAVTDLDTGVDYDIQGSALIKRLASADHYTEEKKVSRTEMAETLVASRNTPFTVRFVKKDGEDRRLRGRLIKPEAILGRSMVEDFDKEGGVRDRISQVDHRTIYELIVDGVKYTLKSQK
jgi:hypothetical protein